MYVGLYVPYVLGTSQNIFDRQIFFKENYDTLVTPRLCGADIWKA